MQSERLFSVLNIIAQSSDLTSGHFDISGARHTLAYSSLTGFGLCGLLWMVVLELTTAFGSVTCAGTRQVCNTTLLLLNSLCSQSTFLQMSRYKCGGSKQPPLARWARGRKTSPHAFISELFASILLLTCISQQSPRFLLFLSVVINHALQIHHHLFSNMIICHVLLSGDMIFPFTFSFLEMNCCSFLHVGPHV